MSTAARGRSITERSNDLTTDIDLASATGIVRLLRQADAQIFAGWGTEPGLGDEETVDRLTKLALLAAGYLRVGNPVVLAGAGTSGRLAMVAAREFSNIPLGIRSSKISYLMAGGPAALIQAQEGAEDDAVTGQRELVELCAGNPVFYVGITCGFSAPYVAGQLDAVLSGPLQGHAVLLGFNTPDLARNAPVEGWPHTFRDSVDRLQAAPNGYLLNPIIGPEPVTGSTRMKSGTATKILLEVLLATAVSIAAGSPPDTARTTIRTYLQAYRSGIDRAYEDLDDLSGLISSAGHTLRRGGRIFYVGTVGYESPVAGPAVPDREDDNPLLPGVKTDAGIIGLVDASECPPTYGADFQTVRGYLPDGWNGLLPGAGVDLSSKGDLFQFSLDDFIATRLPTLSEHDLVITLGDVPGRDEIIYKTEAAGAVSASIDWNGMNPSMAHHRVHYGLSPMMHPLGYTAQDYGLPMFMYGPTQVTVKLLLNAITTGGHILAGKVYGNRMIDLRISNNKLYYRTLGIISDLMGVDEPAAVDALLRSVYGTDSVSEDVRGRAVSAHIDAAKDVKKLVPRALLLATGQFTVAEADKALASNPVVRAILSEHVRA